MKLIPALSTVVHLVLVRSYIYASYVYINCVDLIRLNLLVPKFFGKSRGCAAASIPAVQKGIRRGSVAYCMKGNYGNSNF